MGIPRGSHVVLDKAGVSHLAGGGFLRCRYSIWINHLLFHTMVGSNDIERSKQFYNALLGTLGASEATLNIASSGHTRLFYHNANGTSFIVSQPINDEPATVANGSTVAFSCSSPDQVQRFHAVAVANGGTSIEEVPGPRESAMGMIHLAYVRDPDGNKLCGIYIPE